MMKYNVKFDNGEPDRIIPQFPHCDPKVLHSPKDNCEYCNEHPDWQELRKAWNIAFTGRSYETYRSYDSDGNAIQLPKIQCPAEQARSFEIVNRWDGNRIHHPDSDTIPSILPLVTEKLSTESLWFRMKAWIYKHW